MDVVRTRRRPSAARAVLTILAGLLVIGGLVWSLPTLLGRRAASGPSVPLGSLVIDTVRRGALERDVTAGGTFGPTASGSSQTYPTASSLPCPSGPGRAFRPTPWSRNYKIPISSSPW